jgi:carbonic anhydrase
VFANANPRNSLEQSVKDDVAALKADPILSKRIIVIGYVYDVKTGLLREIVRE